MTAPRKSLFIITLAALLLPGAHVPARAATPPDATAVSASSAAALPVVEAVLTHAPQVPPPITRDYPAHVIVHLEVEEVVRHLADGVEYNFWTFGGQVPGEFIRVREGDTVEVHLSNSPDDKFPHNIDMHAVTGPGGGATSSFTAPGHTSVFTFKALQPGLFVYHCATAPVGMHIANGMYGLILVQPKAGQPKVDHEYYVMQGEFYTTGPYGQAGLQGFDLQKALDERPPYVVFNGAVDSLTGDHALTAKVGDKVRIYFGNAGPNLISSFHVIGEIFDTVHLEGGSTVTHDVQTTLVPPGGSTIVEFKTEVPGTYILVDHAVFRAFNKGALGMLKVEGPENKAIYTGKEVDAVYLGRHASNGTGAAAQVAQLQSQVNAEIADNPKIQSLTKDIQMARGKEVFMQTCFACHQPTGEGIPGIFPPLAKSDFLMANRERAIGIVAHGLQGTVTVKGKSYTSAMPELGLSDDQIANVLTYVTNTWGNEAEPFSVNEVAKVTKGASPANH